MDIHTNIPLKDYTTMRLGGKTRFMAEVKSKEEIITVVNNAKSQNLPIFILGGGSNVIAKDEGFNGIVIRVRISGFEAIADDTVSTTIKIGVGENWDSIVKRTVDMGLGGIEAMSAIPGTVGAAPVQNVGAYGQEIADTLQSLEAFDIQTDSFVTLSNSDCKFSYRDSIFKNESKGRYIITSITLKLSKNLPAPPFYEALQRYFDENKISSPTVEIIRNAVIEIRKNKLPDPKTTPNSGSFFKNAIINTEQLNNLNSKYPDAPNYSMGGGMYKIPTGWLIEHAGFKGLLLHGIRVHDKNSLVLINESATSYNDLAAARNEIITKVYDMFGIQIEQEPLEI